MLKSILLIGLGGAIGSIFRYLTTLLIGKYWTNHLPLATLITNVVGCLLIGIFIGLLDRQQAPNNELKWLLVTGFCGGFTTFSTFSLENINLLQNGNVGTAFLYIGLSVILGLAAVWLGLFLSK